jgi:hypothetical protein
MIATLAISQNWPRTHCFVFSVLQKYLRRVVLGKREREREEEESGSKREVGIAVWALLLVEEFGFVASFFLSIAVSFQPLLGTLWCSVLQPQSSSPVDVICFAFGTAGQSKGARIKNFYSSTSRSGFFAAKSCSDHYDRLYFVLVRSSRRGILLFCFYFYVCVYVFLCIWLWERRGKDGEWRGGLFCIWRVLVPVCCVRCAQVARQLF